MTDPVRTSPHVSDLAVAAAQGHPLEACAGRPRVRAIEGAVFLGANDNGRLDDDLFAMYADRLA